MPLDKAQFVGSIPAFAEALAGADVIDIKTVESEHAMRQFIARVMSYQPGWITLLYRVRGVFVRLFGMRQRRVPRPAATGPDDVPMKPGDPAYFFRVVAAEEDHYWLAGIDDSHLNAHLGAVVEPLAGSRRRYYVVTLVHYNNWHGRVYFNVICPFHHLVVRAMMRHAAKVEPTPRAGAAV
jgi:hypothetical protein